jgi:RimJ/RimL family protein N-acetyltransferase
LGRPPFWGQGYASEAVAALAEFAADLGRGPVVASHFADNPASGRVLAKNGFAYTGESAMRFSLARGEAALLLGMARPANAQVKAA